jgi:hypothetical protein
LSGLLCRGFFERPCRQACGRSDGYLLHLGQIDIQPWSLISEGPSDNDFSPALGQLLHTLQILGR